MKTFEEYLVNKYQRTDDKPSATAEAYLGDVRHYAGWYGGQNAGRELTPALVTAWDVRDYKRHLRTQEYAPRTINRRVEALRAYCDWGRETGTLGAGIDPLRDIKPEPLPRNETKWLAREAQKDLLGTVRVHMSAEKSTDFKRARAAWVHAAVQIMRCAGLRVSELCALTLEDVTLPKRGEGTIVVRDGKGGVKRTVPLHRDAVTAVDEWLAVRPAVPHGALLVGKRGEAMQPRGVQRALAELGQRAGVDVSPHTLRHCAGHEMAKANGLLMASMLLGHASLQTTKIYAEPSYAELQAAVGGM